MYARYKEDMTPNQKAQVKQLIKHQNHHTITGDILRELNESKSRGEGQASADSTAPQPCSASSLCEWPLPFN